ncbi:MAG: hypothetical protein ACI9G1_002028 [Pirellulaceae bacterium]|jgi:hypothetical protein
MTFGIHHNSVQPTGTSKLMFRRLVALLITLSLMSTSTRAVLAQPASKGPGEYTIKAAYLYSLLRYIKWPPTAFAGADSPLVIGIYGEIPAELGASLKYYEERKQIEGRSITVRHTQTWQEVAGCHMVFVRRSVDPNSLSELVAQCSKAPVLFVGETDGFLESGGAVSFSIIAMKVKIHLAPKVAESKGIKPSAWLLRAAGVPN